MAVIVNHETSETHAPIFDFPFGNAKRANPRLARRGKSER
jgi:hypothetical protein